MEKEVSKTKIVIWIFPRHLLVVGSLSFCHPKRFRQGIYNATWSLCESIGRDCINVSRSLAYTKLKPTSSFCVHLSL